MMGRISRFAALAAMLALVSALLPVAPAEPRGATGASSPLKIGDALEMFTLFTLDPGTPEGARVNLRDYLGDGPRKRRALLISFYALWCAPCQTELPFLKALATKNGPLGLQIVLVSIDKEEEEVALGEQVFASGALPFPVLLDKYQIVYRRFGLSTLPAVYLAGPDGKIRLFVDGFVPSIGERIEAEVAALLK